MSHEAPNEDFEQLLEFIKKQRGFDYTGYKRASLSRRFQKRMQAVGISAFADYRTFLETHPDEFASLFDTILINVTSFFRDKPRGTSSRATSSRASSIRSHPARTSASGRPAAQPVRRRTRRQCCSPRPSARTRTATA